jgi:UDP-3-O-acyl-N-acetylglucosamine deacetylase
VRLIRQAGIVEQDAERPVLRIMEPVTIQDGDAIITALPVP